MPYENEFAHYKPLRRIADSAEVQGLLKRMRPRPNNPSASDTSVPIVPLADLKPSNWTPDFVLAIDGSEAEVPVKNGYPMAAVGYVTVASVLLDVAKMIKLDAQRPVDPKEFRTIENAESIDSALPTTNVVVDDDLDTVDSFRRTLFELLLSKRMSDEAENLLETYEALLNEKPTSDRQQCPYEDCLLPDRSYQRGKGTYKCRCLNNRSLFSTDALRIHESMKPDSSNISALTQTLGVLERLWLVHFLRSLEKENLLPVLQRMAIVIDGPLAVFDDPAWLSSPIKKELKRINEETKKAIRDDRFDLLILGIEKTGAFVEHLSDLDRGPNGEMDFLPRQAAVLLTDDYIKQKIVFSSSDREYGRNTYFGRKLFYKAKSGALLVANIPFLADDHSDIRRADIGQFPRLADAMNLLDSLVSARYRNSVTPIITAHAEAAIPLNLGKRVLQQLARQLMNTVTNNKP